MYKRQPTGWGKELWILKYKQEKIVEKSTGVAYVGAYCNIYSGFWDCSGEGGCPSFVGEDRPFGKPGQPLFEGRTEKTGAQLRGVDGVAAIVAGTVFDPIEVVRALAHALQDGVQHVDVVLFAVRPDQVRLAQTSLRQDRPHGRRVVLGVDPVAHVQAVAVELRAAMQNGIKRTCPLSSNCSLSFWD